MNRKLLPCLLAALLCAVPLSAQTTKPGRVIYIPKVKGASKQRIDGATRGGTETPVPVVRVLTPQETALVAEEKPKLYWTIDRPTKCRCDVLVKTLDDEPVYEQHYDGIAAAGLVAVDMASGTGKLAAGRDYRFTVLVSVDPNEPASDIESSGAIRYQPPSGETAKAAADADPVRRATAYAADGYFADAVAALAGADSADAKAALDDLLRQVKLKS